MARQKRWRTEEEINGAIDEVKNSITKFLAQAEHLEMDARSELAAAEKLTKPEDCGRACTLAESARSKIARASKFRKRAARAEFKRLPCLKRILAAFLTQPMPFLDGDIAVVEQ